MKSGERQKVVRLVVLTVAMLLLSAGAARGEYLEVMEKAVRICLECIGIG